MPKDKRFVTPPWRFRIERVGNQFTTINHNLNSQFTQQHIGRSQTVLAVHPLDSPHHPGQVVRTQIGAGGQAETVPKERLGHAAAHAFAAVEDGLHGAWVPDRTRLDVLRFQSQAHVVWS